MSGLSGSAKRVLLVEDNVDDERLALRAFQFCKLPVEVDVAHDGIEVLKVLGLADSDGHPQEAQTKQIPDLVLCDLKLPLVKGDEVLAQVRSEPSLADLPFVMFSSSDEKEDVERCMALGATAYCVKPIDYRLFIDCIEDVVRNYLPDFASGPEPSCLAASATTG
jgi:two-component system response regulator